MGGVAWYCHTMEIHTLLLIKPFVYFGVLFLAAKFLRAPGQPDGGMLRLGLLALGRLVAGMVLGSWATIYVDDLADGSRDAILMALGLVGFGLWLGTGKLAFRTAPPKPLMVFALAAEAVSIAMDSLMLDAAEKIRFC